MNVCIAQLCKFIRDYKTNSPSKYPYPTSWKITEQDNSYAKLIKDSSAFIEYKGKFYIKIVRNEEEKQSKKISQSRRNYIILQANFI